MRLVATALCAALIAGCATTPPAPPPPSQTPTPEPPPTVTPSPPPTPVPTRVPSAPPPTKMPLRDLDPPLIRVLLTRSKSAITIPQPGRAYRVTVDGKAAWMWGPLSLGVVAAGAEWWQVGAFADTTTVSSAVVKMEQEWTGAIQVRREPAPGGLTRLRVRWTAAKPANPGAALAAIGFAGAFPVADAGVLRIDGAQGGSVSGRSEALIEPAGEWPVAADGKRYRGRLVARAVGGEVLLVNELNIEKYLQGVVPAEMGPSQFPELDALKAQTVAARTYAVAHLGDHADEGWDLCDTPTCQVYKGVGVEHRLSNRAVEETAGLIAVFDGQPINAMYTSTCGGHTEDMALLFQGDTNPYLKGVRCSWDRPIPLVGMGRDGSWVSTTEFAAAVALEALALPPDAHPEQIVKVLRSRSGTAVDGSKIKTVEEYSIAVLAAVGVDPPAGIAPAASGLERLLFMANLYKIPLDPPVDGLSGAWPAAAALAALELRGDVVRDRGEAVPRPSGAGIFPRRADHGEDLNSPLPLWERWNGGYRRIAATQVLPGTQLERLRLDDQVLALAVRRSDGDGEADRRSAWREWVRERSWSELERSLGMSGLARLTVTARSPSGRVIGLEAASTNGTVKQWRGFDVRRALELPETLFSMHLRTTGDGERRVHFLGRGWGHGIGLCQNGAYGLARSGMEFEQILKHYYSGIQLTRWIPGGETAAAR